MIMRSKNLLTANTFLSSLLAGLCISIGGTAFLSVGGGLIGAVLFSIGLLLVIEMGHDLFTGKVCYAKIANIPSLLLILVGNILSCIIVGSLVAMTRPSVIGFAEEICRNKLSEPWWAVIILGMFCNFMIYYAVANKNPVITVFCVVVFITCGFEHSIANTYYMTVSGLLGSLRGILYILLNISGNTIGGLLIHRLVIRQ